MKTKCIFLIIFSLFLGQTAEAQFLKKLKKKAEQAAERTVLNKTDEIVSETTDNTIDGAVKGGEKKTETQNTSNNADSTNQAHQSSPGLNPMASSNTKTKLPESYDFDWEFKTEIKTSNDETMEMNYLINSSSNEYFGMEMSSEELKGKGTVCMVTDTIQKTMTMFMNSNGQKMAQITKIHEQKSSNKDPQYSFKEIGTKIILGYTCYGMQVENADYLADIYFTLDAPVNFSALFAFANNKKGPKGFDPALLQVLEEDALLMEVTGTDKKNKNQTFTMTAVSLEQKETTIKTNEYQTMPGF